MSTAGSELDRFPPGTCDSHFHVFGPVDQYPLIPAALYRPPPAELADYRRQVDGLGIDRFVLVQPSVYGTDNRCLLDALAILGPEVGRGVVVIADDRPDPADLREWHQLGVRGLRLET